MTTIRGCIVASGGLAWLTGIVILETLYEESDESLPQVFLLLALLAGLTVAGGSGQWLGHSIVEPAVSEAGWLEQVQGY